jgi:hypothetical protein
MSWLIDWRRVLTVVQPDMLIRWHRWRDYLRTTTGALLTRRKVRGRQHDR